MTLLNMNEKVVEIQCGGIYTMVRTNQGRVFSCGHGISFALGHGSQESLSIFKEIYALNSTNVGPIK